jgi:hypothetical protein
MWNCKVLKEMGRKKEKGQSHMASVKQEQWRVSSQMVQVVTLAKERPHLEFKGMSCRAFQARR